MKEKCKLLFIMLLCSFYIIPLKGQESITATGGNATGSGGSISYTIGQVTYQAIEGTTGTITQGVQQPYEISVVTALENTEGITLEYRVYPNPTKGQITLVIQPFDNERMSYRLLDMNGVILQDNIIESGQVEISMDNLPSSVYFLKVITNNKEVKAFKIIKN